MGLSRGSIIVREGLLGPEYLHGFGYIMALPLTALKNRLTGAMSNAIKDLVETLPMILGEMVEKLSKIISKIIIIINSLTAGSCALI
jgi:hypothetical protein